MILAVCLGRLGKREGQREESYKHFLDCSRSTFAKSARYRKADNMLRMAQGNNKVEQDETY
jgi:hypothetical protein